MLVRNNDRKLLHDQLFSFDPRYHVSEDRKVRDPGKHAGQTGGRHSIPLNVRYCIGECRVCRRREDSGDEEERAGQADCMVSGVRVAKAWVSGVCHLRIDDGSSRAAPGPEASLLRPCLSVSQFEVEQSGGHEEADEDDGDVRVERE